MTEAVTDRSRPERPGSISFLGRTGDKVDGLRMINQPGR
jgi:hypothetical protein